LFKEVVATSIFPYSTGSAFLRHGLQWRLVPVSTPHGFVERGGFLLAGLG
jgi:hypothetical protein